jgi:hypothetical protein
MTDPGQIWASFTLDPRRPEYAPLRASDQDRNVVHQVLADAYADGRLDRDEFETRTADVIAAKTLGELAGLVDGLVPTSAALAMRPPAGLMSDAQLQERAVARWHRERREALLGLISVSAIVWVIWFLTTGPGHFPWPAIVSAAAFVNLMKTHLQRDEIVASERRRLEKKQQREIEKRRRKGELE